MNKDDKRVIQYQLDEEKAVLKDLRRQYEKALADINSRIKILQADDTPSRAYQVDYQKTLKAQVEAILEKLHADEYDSIHKYLTDSYTSGYVGTMYTMGRQSGVHVVTPLDRNAAFKAIVTDSELKADLYTSIGIDLDKLKKTIREEITRGIATSLPYEQIARSISDRMQISMHNANRIVRTEGHRIQQASADDARNAAKENGADVVKMWDASLDGATRKVHRELDGQIRETNEQFVDSSGKWKAMYPGKFGKPEQDCNCRCVALTRARWALDEDELETLKERAAFFKLDKTKDFEEYKTKYLKAGKELVNSGRVTSQAKDKKGTNPAKAALTDANGRFVNKNDMLFRNAANIEPIEGYEDFTCHADPDSFTIYMDDDTAYTMTPEEYAERIRNSTTYNGGNIRIISCQSGAKEDGAAQKLSDALGVNVYAPTETVFVSESGKMFLSDNDKLAWLWYNNGEDKSGFKETGKWKVFKPRKR